MLHLCTKCGDSFIPGEGLPDGYWKCSNVGCNGCVQPITKTFPATRKQKHPIQPVGVDEKGDIRFKRNEIVRHLLDNGGIGMNALGAMAFSKEDWTQFAQLIGYTVVGAGELPYFDKNVIALADTRVAALMNTADPEMRRASGDVVCKTCGQEYRKHPHSQHRDNDANPWLHVLCDGSRVKL